MLKISHTFYKAGLYNTINYVLRDILKGNNLILNSKDMMSSVVLAAI